MTAENSKAKSRTTLLILLAVFLAPLVGGYGWYFFGDNFRTKNYGDLFSPARAAADVELLDLAGQKVSMQQFTSKWTIMFIGPSDCPDDCMAQLDKVSRMRYMQSERMRRIQNVFVADGKVDEVNLSRIEMVLKPGTVLSMPESSRAQMVSLFTRVNESAEKHLHRIYLLDPIGNLVLSYPLDADLAKIRKDLSRLLRISQIG